MFLAKKIIFWITNAVTIMIYIMLYAIRMS